MSLRPPPQHPTRSPSGTRPAAPTSAPSESQTQTPPLPPRPVPSSANSQTLTVPSSNEPLSSPTIPSPAVDDELSEFELREQYEDEEIERFLTFFSAHVTEVRISGSGKSQQKVDIVDNPSLLVNEDQSDDDANVHVQDDPLKPTETLPRVGRSSVNLHSGRDSGWASQIATNYVIPFLPPPPHPPPPFSVGRLGLTAQRLYAIAEGGYLPLLLGLKRLSTWEDFNRSAIYCSAFWVLWTCDLLLSAFFLYLLYDLLSRKLRPYPSLQELREHRRKIMHAEQFGQAVQTRVLSASSFDIKDVWRLWRMLPRPKASSKKDKGTADSLKEGDQDNSSHEGDASPAPSDSTPSLLIESTENEVSGPADVDLEPPMDEQDMRKLALQGLSELADFHERCFNLYMWRRPRSSMACSVALVFLVLTTSFVPARYLAKMTYFVVGLVYWHVIPVIAALPASERARIPKPLQSAPTNAEVAMELMSQRVAQGLPVLPPRPSKRKHASSTDVQGSPAGSTATVNSRGDDKSEVDWTKWGERAATSKQWASDVKGFVTRNPRNRADPANIVETHSFPGHHKSGPGLITLTTTTLYFTPLVSSSPSLTIALGEVTGMKKKGVLKGLSISWNSTEEGGTVEEKTEVFRWIGGRDEVFARVLSSEGRRWVKV